jgi:hypothetical protein
MFSPLKAPLFMVSHGYQRGQNLANGDACTDLERLRTMNNEQYLLRTAGKTNI